jgi:hypothetical protein
MRQSEFYSTIILFFCNCRRVKIELRTRDGSVPGPAAVVLTVRLLLTGRWFSSSGNEQQYDGAATVTVQV